MRRGEEATNATRVFLGDEAHWVAARVELRDVQSLWGGRNIFVSGSNQVTVQRVLQGSHEECRYAFELPVDECKQIWETLIENDFLAIQPGERMGIPDEARPSITLVNASGDKKTISKWAGVKEERFDEVYAVILGLETFATSLVPIYSGPYEPDMKPL